MTQRAAIAGTLCVVLSLSLSVVAAFASPLVAIALLSLAALGPLLWVIAPSDAVTVVSLRDRRQDPAVATPHIARSPRAPAVARTTPHLVAVPAPAPSEARAMLELVRASTPRSLRTTEPITP